MTSIHPNVRRSRYAPSRERDNGSGPRVNMGAKSRDAPSRDNAGLKGRRHQFNEAIRRNASGVVGGCALLLLQLALLLVVEMAAIHAGRATQDRAPDGMAARDMARNSARGTIFQTSARRGLRDRSGEGYGRAHRATKSQSQNKLVHGTPQSRRGAG